MSLRDDLIPLVDTLRQEVVDDVAGLRLDTVVVRTRAWSGGQIGRGTATDTDLTLSPRPKVKPPDPRLTAGAGGTYEAGDLIVEKISATYTPAQLGESPSAAAEVIWLVSGEEYRLVSLTEGYLQWSASLRRMRKR